MKEAKTMSNFPAWVGATSKDAGKSQPGALALMAYIVLDRGRGARNWGIYNYRKVAGTSYWSLHGEGRALDVGFALVDGKANPEGTRLVKELLPLVGKLGIQCIIWNRTLWSAKHPNGTRYNGVSPHIDHIHIELTWKAALGLTRAIVRAAFGYEATTPAVSGMPNGKRLVSAWDQGRNQTWVWPGEVKALQIKLDAGLVIDGKYGEKTTEAVLEYQETCAALVNDGIAGPKTVQHLWNY
jgi:hypothetical protein